MSEGLKLNDVVKSQRDVLAKFLLSKDVDGHLMPAIMLDYCAYSFVRAEKQEVALAGFKGLMDTYTNCPLNSAFSEKKSVEEVEKGITDFFEDLKKTLESFLDTVKDETK